MGNSVLWLRRQFNWMGAHSGYDRLCEEIPQLVDGQYHSTWQELGKRRNKLSRGVLKRLAANAKTSPVYNIDSVAAEFSTVWQSWRHQPDLIHVTYVENHLGVLPFWKEKLTVKLVGTVHQPSGWWRLYHRHPQILEALDGLIVLSSRDVPYFNQFLPGRVYCIPHGVDTDFFQPLTLQSAGFTVNHRPRCVFSGKYLRDFPTLAAVVDQVLAQNPAIQFDLILPHKNRLMVDDTLIRLARYDQVHWYADLSDEDLRSLYQQANLLVLPLLDCTANNGVLEAIACGLPVVSNAVGGMSDYTRPTFADLHPVGDVLGLTQSILSLVENSQEQVQRSQAARAFAEAELSWAQVAQRTLDIYSKVLF